MTAIAARNTQHKCVLVPGSDVSAGETGACQEMMVYVSMTYHCPLLRAADTEKPTDGWGGMKHSLQREQGARFSTPVSLTE